MTSNTFYVYVLKVWNPTIFFFLIRRFFLSTRRLVSIVALEDDGFVLDVGHHDVGDVYLSRFSSTTHRTFEAQSCVCAAETVLPNHHTSDAACGVTSQHKTTMSMINHIVLHNDVLASVGRGILLVCTDFHADAIIAHIDNIINYQPNIDIREVYAIAILGIPENLGG